MYNQHLRMSTYLSCLMTDKLISGKGKTCVALNMLKPTNKALQLSSTELRSVLAKVNLHY